MENPTTFLFDSRGVPLRSWLFISASCSKSILCWRGYLRLRRNSIDAEMAAVLEGIRSSISSFLFGCILSSVERKRRESFWSLPLLRCCDNVPKWNRIKERQERAGTRAALWMIQLEWLRSLTPCLTIIPRKSPSPFQIAHIAIVLCK